MKRITSLLTFLFASLIIAFAQTNISPINIGVTNNDKTGDTLRVAFGKVNANFTYVTNLLSLSTNGFVTASITNGLATTNYVQSYSDTNGAASAALAAANSNTAASVASVYTNGANLLLGNGTLTDAASHTLNAFGINWGPITSTYFSGNGGGLTGLLAGDGNPVSSQIGVTNTAKALATVVTSTNLLVIPTTNAAGAVTYSVNNTNTASGGGLTNGANATFNNLTNSGVLQANGPIYDRSGNLVTGGGVTTNVGSYIATNGLSAWAADHGGLGLKAMDANALRRGVYPYLYDALLFQSQYRSTNHLSYFGRPYSVVGTEAYSSFGFHFDRGLANRIDFPVNLSSNFTVAFVYRNTNALEYDGFSSLNPLTPSYTGEQTLFAASNTNSQSGVWMYEDPAVYAILYSRSATNFYFANSNSWYGGSSYGKYLDCNGYGAITRATYAPKVEVVSYNGNGFFQVWRDTYEWQFPQTGSNGFTYPYAPEICKSNINLIQFGYYASASTNSYSYPVGNFDWMGSYGNQYSSSGTFTNTSVSPGLPYAIATKTPATDYGFFNNGTYYPFIKCQGTAGSQPILLTPSSGTFIFTGAPNATIGTHGYYPSSQIVQQFTASSYELAAVFIFNTNGGYNFAAAAYSMYHDLDYKQRFDIWHGSSIISAINDNSWQPWNGGRSFYYHVPDVYELSGEPNNTAWVDFSSAGSTFSTMSPMTVTPLTELDGQREVHVLGDEFRNTAFGFGLTTATNQFFSTYWPYYTNGASIDTFLTHLPQVSGASQLNQNSNLLATWDGLKQIPWANLIYDEAAEVNSNMMLNKNISQDATHFNGTNQAFWRKVFAMSLKNKSHFNAGSQAITGTVTITNNWTNFPCENTYELTITVGTNVAIYGYSGQLVYTNALITAPVTKTILPNWSVVGTGLNAVGNTTLP
jgi:hypothetical protein